MRRGLTMLLLSWVLPNLTYLIAQSHQVHMHPKSIAGASQAASWSLQCGLWRTDTGFNSTIQIKNRLVTGPMSVTPVLFMVDGTEYDLPPVTLPAAGVTTVNVNSSLANIPAGTGIASHVSQYGSAALRYTGSQTSVIAQMAFGSQTLSLSYMASFTAVASGAPASQTLEGLWWARDAGIGGFISLSNATSEVRTGNLQAVTASGQVLPAQPFSLTPHATQMLDLLTLVGQLQAGDAGGLRVQFTGRMGEVNVTGGLENQQEGYSAVMPFWMPPMTPASASVAPAVTLAYPGIMVGTPDAMMGFPADTQFAPYLALRNITSRTIPVTLTLYTEQGTPLQVPSQSLAPWQSLQVDLGGALQQLGMKDFSGTVTLTVGHTGQTNDILAAAGSVDARGTYVFEVQGRTVEQRVSKQSPYWTVKDGSDTMAALWNPSASAEDVIVTLSYVGGSGVYHFQVHLAPHATANLDILELLADQSPDADGNVVPRGVQEGSFTFHSAAGIQSPVYLNVNVGIYNVVKGTCYYGTIWCDGYVGNLILSPDPIYLTPQENQVVVAYGQYSTGDNYQVNASWTSSNTSVATVADDNGAGNVTGVATGTATITATASLPPYGEYSGYNPSCEELQENINFTGTAPADIVQLKIVSASIPQNQIQVQVSLPSGMTGDLTLTLTGADGGSPTDPIPTGDAIGNGTYNYQFNFNNIPIGLYQMVSAEWSGDGLGMAASLNYAFQVMGTYAQTQYNTPYEGTCSGSETPVTLWTVTSKCASSSGQMLSGFTFRVADPTTGTGSGQSINYGGVQPEQFCTVYSTTNFRQHVTITGSLGGLSNSTVAVCQSSSLYGGGNQLWIQGEGTKTVTDACPACCKAAGYAQLDNYTTSNACSGIGSLPSALTIWLNP